MAIGRRYLKKLRKLVGPGHVYTAAEDLISYSYDAAVSGAMPDVVVHPGSVEEVVAVIKAAEEEGMPVVPRGSGTGLSGGSVAAQGGIVLHFDRMNRLRDLDARDMVAVAEPGMTNFQLKKFAAEAGLFYPPDPGSLKVSTLGGNVAENAGGPYGVKYGVTSDYVLGLEVVLASGEVIQTGGPSRRNVSGYNLTGLMVGSEGTLGVTTGITLKLLPQPPQRSAAMYSFKDVVAAGEAVVSLSAAGLVPAALEIIDRMSMDCAKQFSPGLFPAEAAAVLLVEVDGRPETVEIEMKQVGDAFGAAGGLPEKIAGGVAADEIWEARRAVPASLARMGPAKIGEDVSVPLSRVPEMIGRIGQIAARHGVTIAVFGHAGDGNLHPNILTDPRDPELAKKTEAAISDLFEAALELGGTLSGEHGIGTAKAPYLRYALTPETMAAMKKIKQALDPGGIMNPGKIFAEEA